MNLKKQHEHTYSRRNFLTKAGLLTSLPFIAPLDDFAEDLAQAKRKSLRVLTCNIRVDLEEDATKGLAWKDRRVACLHVIGGRKADVIGFQEVLKNQFLDLKKSMSGYVGIGFDGPEMDEHQTGYHGIAKNPIFFSKKRFELLAAGGYWLSETPLKAGSISWGSARARNASWVRLYDKYTQKEFRLINLHLDHVSNEAKIKQIQMVLEESAQYQSDFPQILTGDFNAAAQSAVIKPVFQAGWKDTFVEVHGNTDPGNSTHGFKGEAYEKKDIGKKIDFIFTKGTNEAINSHVIRDAYKNIYPSDHYFLEAEINL
ncbi:endonuclease/exonuclease/phosphatase family protein [Sphingobacterium olei]|uniref:Endonuclease/exonuclease/phosphatase family protein n=1 Tax=Sphingobacterium olei TaxID=2571155 RepID=A0A4U0P830_9SPHI|nr:endonuclease/exonuclease/phosphatase family protein [Sphingobacterium olei]TJZ62942.1 endonuclease/exonuclease/phosphatase family protein [Sphingobacterium olei]